MYIHISVYIYTHTDTAQRHTHTCTYVYAYVRVHASIQRGGSRTNLARGVCKESANSWRNVTEPPPTWVSVADNMPPGSTGIMKQPSAYSARALCVAVCECACAGQKPFHKYTSANNNCVHMYTCVCVCARVCASTCVCLCVSIGVHAFMCVHVCVCM